MSDLSVRKEDFQTAVNDKKTDLFVLSNSNGMKVAITNYGARVVSWLAPDQQGNYDDIVLGFDSIQGYLDANQVYFGAIIGRYCNRIAKGTFSLDGQKYTLNTNDGANHLHGGPHGYHGYDHNFVLHKEDKGLLTEAAKVSEPTSGRVLEVYTTEPGLQFYGGNFLSGSDVGKDGKPYKKRSAFCLEPQHFPNSPNEPGFPSTTLKPDDIYHSCLVFQLSTNT